MMPVSTTTMHRKDSRLLQPLVYHWFSRFWSRENWRRDFISRHQQSDCLTSPNPSVNLRCFMGYPSHPFFTSGNRTSLPEMRSPPDFPVSPFLELHPLFLRSIEIRARGGARSCGGTIPKVRKEEGKTEQIKFA
jgi:hypothetical protein